MEIAELFADDVAALLPSLTLNIALLEVAEATLALLFTDEVFATLALVPALLEVTAVGVAALTGSIATDVPIKIPVAIIAVTHNFFAL